MVEVVDFAKTKWIIDHSAFDWYHLPSKTKQGY